MSALQRQMLKAGLPPLTPTAGIGRTIGGGKGSGSGSGSGGMRRRDYTPTKWDKYFERYEDVNVKDDDVFRVYRSGDSGPLLLFLHGGGYCGLTWATLTTSILSLIDCQVAALDLRGHGETRTSDDFDLAAETLSNDVGNVVKKMFDDSAPEIVLVGHSMGGAIAVHTAYKELIPSLIGLAVIDVVEGTAMDALQSMQSFLRSRPSHFKSIEAAVEWCVRSGQVRNHESARVSMPGQIKNARTNKPGTADLDNKDSSVASASHRPLSSDVIGPLKIQRSNDSIPEEQEEPSAEAEEKKDEEKETTSPRNSLLEPITEQGDGGKEAAGSSGCSSIGDGSNSSSNNNKVTSAASSLSSYSEDSFLHPSKVTHPTSYTWRIDLSQTERFWPGWFHGLSGMFLSCPIPKMLLLAGIDRLDRELTIGQMQGKFQMQVLPQCGHAVHEDVPDKVAEVLATFLVRHRFVQATANFQPTFPAC